jgi:hypothetical protein
VKLSDSCTLDAGWPKLPGADIAARMRDAMRAEHCVAFAYDGKYRLVEVHAIGRSPKDGSLVMRGLQISGEASRPLPQWTLFTVAKMEGFDEVPQHSKAPREGYAMGDKQMAPVLTELAL